MCIEFLCRNWLPLHSPCFLPLFVTSHGSLPRAYFSLYLWRMLMKFRDALNFSSRMVSSLYPLDSSHANLYQIDHFIIHDALMYLVISHINVLRLLVIPMILSEMNRILTVAINPNWILYDTEYLNQSSQSQSFL